MILSSQQLAGELGISRRTVNTWRELGIIQPYIRIGRIIRYHLDDVTKQVRAHTEGTRMKWRTTRDNRTAHLIRDGRQTAACGFRAVPEHWNPEDTAAPKCRRCENHDN